MKKRYRSSLSSLEPIIQGDSSKFHVSLYGIDQAVDLVIVTPEQVEHYKNSPSTVVYPALREGRVIYHAESVHA